jgi:hypothetical protein
MANRRLYYGITMVGVRPDGVTSVPTAIHGLQSIGITTNFRLDNIFELGQLAIYQTYENVPDIEVTSEKVLDGYPPIYLLATQGAPSATMAGRANQKCQYTLCFFDDFKDSASGTPISEVNMSGLVISAVSYRFPVDGRFSESVTFVGNNKVWNTGTPVFNGVFNNTDVPLAAGVSGGVQHRQHMIFTVPTGGPYDVNNSYDVNTTTVLPQEIDGIDAHGGNPETALGCFAASVQHITVNCNFGREDIFELGRKVSYFKYLRFPIQVTTEIETIAKKWDNVSATEVGGQNGAPLGDNLVDRTIKLRIKEGLFVDLGKKNKLESINLGRGDAGGGNATITYRYQTFNDLTVQHPNDPTAGLRIASVV